MKHDYMLLKATSIASLLLQSSHRLGRMKLTEVPLMASLSISLAASELNIEALDPKIKEILIFGSVARGEEEPGDIDMMVFDDGFYSNVLEFEPPKTQWGDEDCFSSWGGMLKENLQQLLGGWFACSDDICHQFDDVPVDLQVLPLTIITDIEERRALGVKHVDKNFFNNAFSTILRFDESAGKFVPTTLRELEEKYSKVLAA